MALLGTCVHVEPEPKGDGHRRTLVWNERDWGFVYLPIASSNLVTNQFPGPWWYPSRHECSGGRRQMHQSGTFQGGGGPWMHYILDLLSKDVKVFGRWGHMLKVTSVSKTYCTDSMRSTCFFLALNSQDTWKGCVTIWMEKCVRLKLTELQHPKIITMITRRMLCSPGKVSVNCTSY